MSDKPQLYNAITVVPLLYNVIIMPNPSGFVIGSMPLPHPYIERGFESPEEARARAQKLLLQDFYTEPEWDWKQTDISDGSKRWDVYFHHWMASVVMSDR